MRKRNEHIWMFVDEPAVADELAAVAPAAVVAALDAEPAAVADEPAAVPVATL